MKHNLIFVIVLLALSSCYTSKDCVCPEYYSPVCGENGKTYMNPCGAECDEVGYIEGECPVYGIGVVMYSGDTLCGFYISILGTQYKPRQIPDEYKVDDLAVTLRYRKMNTWFTCGETQEYYQEVEVLEIGKIL